MIEAKLRVNFPPDPNPRRPELVAPAGSWDSHFHVLAPHLFPYVDSRRYTPPAAPLEHYLAMADVLGLERGCVVQSSFHGADTRVIVDAVARSDGRLRGMIRADPELTPQELRTLHGAGVRGIRLPTLKSFGDGFDEALFARIVSTAAPGNWALSIQLDSDELVRHANVIGGVQIPIIIDTWARIDPRNGSDQPALRTLLDLLSGPKVWVKIHGTNRFLEWGVPYADMVAMGRRLIAHAPDRILWGTDWPHGGVFKINKIPNDGDLLDMLLDFAPNADVRRKILVDNPKALFDGA
jgi:predicted TIM-barrel fold metal-dependent hydrolase